MSEQPTNSDRTPQDEYNQNQASYNAQSAADNQTASSSGQAQNRDTGDIVTELREMGQQLEAVIRAAIESDRSKQLQRDIAGGVKELTTQVKTALKSVQETSQFQQASEKGRETIHRAQHSKTVNDLQETLITGIAQLNLQLRKLVDRIEQPSSSPTGEASSSTVQTVPVEHDTASATGETTRLNTDTPSSASQTQVLNDDDTTKL
jgi:hypothetical protein